MYYFRATCFDSFESSSVPSRNISKFCQSSRCILGSRTLAVGGTVTAKVHVSVVIIHMQWIMV